MVGITAWASLSGEALRTFQPRAELPERKHLKLMTRPVRLGVAAIGRALAARPGWQAIPPERRGLFVGAVPRGAPDALAPALQAARDGDRLDLRAFGERGLPRLHPLWLVQGLSNNIPGYACAYWDVRGPTTNRCEGDVGGLAAIVEAVHAVRRGDVDLAVAGGADTGLRWTDDGPAPDREGAAFVVVERGAGRPVERADIHLGEAPAGLDARAGAASGPLALVACLTSGEAADIRIVDPEVGLSARVVLGASDADAGSG